MTRATRTMNARTTAALGFILAGPLTTAPSHSAIIIREVATSGTPAPGIPGAIFDAVGSPILNEAGSVLYWARLRGGFISSTTEDSLWTDRDGSSQLVMLAGDPSPTNFGDWFTCFPAAAFNDEGRIAVVATFLGPGVITPTTRMALLREDAGGALALRAIEAQAAYTLPSLIPMSDSGAGLFRSDLSKDNSVLSFFGPAYAPSTPVPGAGTGNMPPNATFRQFSDPMMNRHGRSVFLAAAGPAAPTTSWLYAYYTDRVGALARLATVGDATPDGPPDRTLAVLASAPAIDASGRIAFWAAFDDPGVPADLRTAIYLYPPSGPATVIAAAGGAAPGAEPGIFATFSRTVNLGAGGRAAFRGFLSGEGVTSANNEGLWIADPLQATRLLVREGDAVTDASGAFFSHFGDPYVGPSGQIVFTASLTGPEVTQSSGYALFASDVNGQIRLIAREGRPFASSGGVGGTVRRIGFQSAGPGRAQMNGAGEIAFTLWYYGGASGIYVAAFPCPADFNDDGGVDGGDVEAFFVAWEAGDEDADINADGGVDGADVEAFFLLWEAGGC